MNDTSRQILSTNKSISPQVAKFCRLTSRFCKILSIKTLFKQKQGIKYTLFKFPKSLNNGLNRSFLYEFSLLSRTFPDSPKIFSIKIPGFPEILSAEETREQEQDGVGRPRDGREERRLEEFYYFCRNEMGEA